MCQCVCLSYQSSTKSLIHKSISIVSCWVTTADAAITRTGQTCAEPTRLVKIRYVLSMSKISRAYLSSYRPCNHVHSQFKVVGSNVNYTAYNYSFIIRSTKLNARIQPGFILMTFQKLTFGSVCSGIEAASVAWHPLGWQAAWLAEIEPFPARILHHHYGSGHPHHMPDPSEPDLSDEDRKDRQAALKAVSDLPLVDLSGSVPPNLGDMTKIAAMVRSGAVTAPDVLVGGTPCQAFSIAGLRGSLDDARGQLSLSYVDLANAIDTARLLRGQPACISVWENVPGVLSTKDNAFGCFLGALAGEDVPLIAPGGRWSNAGCVFGPQRTVAWRVMDAQYTGVAQRRRRVFVIASAREGFDPTAVLFERDGVRRDIAPSRSKGKEVAGTIASRTDGGGFPGTDEACSGYLQPVDIAATLTSALGRRCGLPECGSADGMLQPVVGTLQSNGKAAGSATQQDAESGLLVAIPLSPSPGLIGAFKGGQGAKAGGIGFDANLSPTLSAADSGSNRAPVVAFDAVGSYRTAGDGAVYDSGDKVAALTTGTDPSANIVTFAIQAGASRVNPNSGPDGIGVQADIAYTLEARAEVQSIAFAQNNRNEVYLCDGDGQIAGALSAGGGKPGQGYPAIAFMGYDILGTPASEVAKTAEVHTPLRARVPGQLENSTVTMVSNGMAVRRLTPRECERLQAFPDDYTLLPGNPLANVNQDKLDMEYIHYLMRSGKLTFEQCVKASADGPRYKALGNSMCVFNMSFIGSRIDFAIKTLTLGD